MNQLQSHVAECPEQLDDLQKPKNTFWNMLVGVWSAAGEEKRATLNVMKKSMGYSGQVAIGKRLAETQNFTRTAWYSQREELAETHARVELLREGQKSSFTSVTRLICESQQFCESNEKTA